jgi:hypothetical protein
MECKGEAVSKDPKEIPQSLVSVLESLCAACPRNAYTEKCPFPKFSGISVASRRALFSAMDMEQVAKLFALSTDCACPKDPSVRAPGGADV